MINLFKQINKKINGVIWSLISTGVILFILSILIVWTNLFIKIIFGLFVLIIAYSFLYTGYKLFVLKKDIKKHFKF